MMQPGYKKLVYFWNNSSATAKWRTAFALLGLWIIICLIIEPKPWDIDLPHEEFKIQQFIIFYAWWAMVFNLLVTAALFIICPWWAKSETHPPLAAASISPARRPAYFLPLIILSIFIFGFFAGQRLDQSLWDDEEYNLRHSVSGRFKYSEKNDEFKFRETRWRETFYHYNVPNNHILHSIIVRITLRTWQVLTGKPISEFNEIVLRLPAFLAALLLLPAAAFLLREYGFTAAGIITSLLLAIHPWILRYGAEARGYSLTLLWVCLLGIIWRRALTRGAWNWWTLWALLQFVALYTVPTSLFIIVVLNLATLPLLYFQKTSTKNFIDQSGRWFISTSAAAMATIQCMLPLVPQAKHYFETYCTVPVYLGWNWVRNVAGFYVGGVSWTKSSTLNSDYPEWMPWVHEHFFSFAAFIILIVIFFLLGLFLFCRRDRFAAILAIAFIADPVGVYAQGAIKKQFIFEWYLILALPLAVGFVAIGVSALSGYLAKKSHQGWLSPALIALSLIGYFSVTHHFRSWLVNNPLQPFRESVLEIRGHLPWEKTSDPKIVTLSFSDPPFVYDHCIYELRSVNQMIHRLQTADAAGATVFVNLGHLYYAPFHSPKMWALLTESGTFEYLKRLPGFDPTLDRHLYKYKSGSISKIDLSKYAGEER